MNILNKFWILFKRKLTFSWKCIFMVFFITFPLKQSFKREILRLVNKLAYPKNEFFYTFQSLKNIFQAVQTMFMSESRLQNSLRTPICLKRLYVHSVYPSIPILGTKNRNCTNYFSSCVFDNLRLFPGFFSCWVHIKLQNSLKLSFYQFG